MVGNRGPVGAVVDLVREDLRQNGANSGLCQYLEFIEEATGGANLGARLARQRFCNPPDLPPAEIERFEAGGDPCKLYDVTVQGTNNKTGEVSTSVLRRNGPIRLNRYRGQNPPNRFVGRDSLLGGDGVNCLATNDLITGFDDIVPEALTGRILAIVPVNGLPDTSTPFPVNPPPTSPPDQTPFPFQVNIDLGGQEVSVPLVFAPIVNIPIGPIIPVFVGINPDFNLNLDLAFNPRFEVGIDLNLSFGIELDGGGAEPKPVPGVEPVERPPFVTVEGGDCEEFDYERIEKKIEDESCCKPVASSEFLGSFFFETPNDVYISTIPREAVFVAFTVIPDNNSRRYKLAGDQSEIALGNATLLSASQALGYEKVFLRRHIMQVPDNLPNPGVRISLKQGCTINVEVFLHGV